jgi:hypothetical protein
MPKYNKKTNEDLEGYKIELKQDMFTMAIKELQKGKQIKKRNKKSGVNKEKKEQDIKKLLRKLKGRTGY